MRINHNLASLNSSRQLAVNLKRTNNSTEKLSSGLRINRAGDDAAGLAISEKMRGQIRGLNQASRNIQDGISLIQTAEGGLNEVHSMLQRGRELAVQASNDTLTAKDKSELQKEIDQLKQEITSISDRTEYNTIKVLSRSTISAALRQQMLDALPGMLQNSEMLIQNHFGLSGDGADMNIFLDERIDGVGGTLAYVSASVYGNEGRNIEMHIDMSDFPTFVAPNGNNDPYNYLDRTIAHELVHAVFDRTLNMDQDLNNDGVTGDLAIPKWFNEGSAEFIKGGADRLYGEIRNRMITNSESLTTAAQAVINSVGNGQSWGGQSINYAAAYGAIMYLNETVGSHSPMSNYKDFLTTLYDSGSRSKSVDDVFATTTWGSLSGFINDYKANGLATVQNLYSGFQSNGDVGAAIPGQTQDGVVGDTLSGSATLTDPMTGWNEIFPNADSNEPLRVQVSANEGQVVGVALAKVDAGSLGISNIDVTVDAESAITSFDNAIETVSGIRARFGALQNRLEHAFSISEISGENLSAAESRIRDVDMAREMMEQTKNSILMQAAQVMLIQANQQPQTILQLLR